MLRAKPASHRLVGKFTKNAETGCWDWTAATNNKGYGVIGGPGKSLLLAHRVSYEAHRELIPEGLVIDHLCRNTRCINPEHLEVVTRAVNQKRGHWPNSRKTHCPCGHPYEGKNLFINNRGRRECRTCKRARNRRNRK